MASRLTPLDHVAVPAGGELHAIVSDVWRRIAAGLDGSWPPWGLPTLATSGASGPRARVLALRSADPDRRTFVFHTDARSDKVREIEADSRVSVVFWDPADGIEARFNGFGVLHRDDDIARAAWQKVSPLRRMASRTVDSPGAPLPQPCRFDALRAQDAGQGGIENFAVIEVEVEHLDWLWVGADDMRRAAFAWSDAGWVGSWTVP